MNQGGNQGDDSTGQHYSVTEHTLHMLIRPRETARGSSRDGQMEAGRMSGAGKWIKTNLKIKMPDNRKHLKNFLSLLCVSLSVICAGF